MRTLGLAVVFAVCSLGSATADPAEEALQTKAEACIRSAAPEVATKAENLTDAVYLLTLVCGVEISRVEAYDVNARTLADWEGRSSATQLAGVALDPVTGELKTPPGFKMEWDSSSAAVRELTRVTPREKLAAFTAQTVIAARKPIK